MSEASSERDTRTVTASRAAVPERLRWAGAALFAGAIACLVYALDRTRAVLFEDSAPPQNVVASARIPYFYRIAMAAFVASLAFAAAAWLLRGREERAFPWLIRGTVVAVTLSCAASIIWP